MGGKGKYRKGGVGLRKGGRTGVERERRGWSTWQDDPRGGD